MRENRAIYRKKMFAEPTSCEILVITLEKATRGTSKWMTLDIIPNKGQMSSQADRWDPHVWTMPGVNIRHDICAVCYFCLLNCSRLTFSYKLRLQ